MQRESLHGGRRHLGDVAEHRAVELAEAATGEGRRLEMALDDEAARLAVRDLGRPGASPPTADPRPPEPASVRGRGRLIISTLADEAEWRPNGHGTEVRLRFGRSGRGDARSPS